MCRDRLEHPHVAPAQELLDEAQYDVVADAELTGEFVGALEFKERHHERLWNVATAVGPEAAESQSGGLQGRTHGCKGDD